MGGDVRMDFSAEVLWEGGGGGHPNYEAGALDIGEKEGGQREQIKWGCTATEPGWPQGPCTVLAARYPGWGVTLGEAGPGVFLGAQARVPHLGGVWHQDTPQHPLPTRREECLGPGIVRSS